MNLLPGWYTDPHRQINLRWWVLAVRWWDAKVWTSFTADRRFGWVPTTLVAAAGLWIWLVGVVMSPDLAHGVAATPQPNQETWVLVSEWLPAIPAAGALMVEVEGSPGMRYEISIDTSVYSAGT